MAPTRFLLIGDAGAGKATLKQTWEEQFAVYADKVEFYLDGEAPVEQMDVVWALVHAPTMDAKIEQTLRWAKVLRDLPIARKSFIWAKCDRPSIFKSDKEVEDFVEFYHDNVGLPYKQLSSRTQYNFLNAISKDMPHVPVIYNCEPEMW